MCGRTRCTLDPDLVARATGVPPEKWVDKEKYHPSYNLSPGHYTPILRNARKSGDIPDAKEGGEEGKGAEPEVPPERIVQCMKWGLVPSFTKKEEKPDFFRMFNARGESIHERSAFRRLLPRSRCVAMVEGFYEWKKDEKSKAKQPYYIHYQDETRPLLFAALCDRWEDAQGNVLHTYTIVTTRISKALEWLHDRMPVILSSESEVDTWLRPELPVEKILQLAKPYESPDLVWHPVTPEVGKPSFDSPACIKEITPTSAATSAIASLFKKAAKPELKGHPGTETRPHLDGPDEEKAFAAAVIPDRDVSKALGKRKDHPEDRGDARPEPGGEASKTSAKAPESDANPPENRAKASEGSEHATKGGWNAAEASKDATGGGVNASGGVQAAFEAASETVGAATDAIKDVSRGVEGAVKDALGKVGGAAASIRDSVGATMSSKGEDQTEGVRKMRESEGEPAETTGHSKPVSHPTTRPPESHQNGAPGGKVSAGHKPGARGFSPKSESKKGKPAPHHGGKGNEPSPKKQKTLTSFFIKK